jgi:hypothetical protein
VGARAVLCSLLQFAPARTDAARTEGDPSAGGRDLPDRGLGEDGRRGGGPVMAAWARDGWRRGGMQHGGCGQWCASWGGRGTGVLVVGCSSAELKQLCSVVGDGGLEA